MKFLGIAKHHNDYKIYFDTPKRKIYELTISKEEESYYYDNYATERIENCICDILNGNISLNPITMKLYDRIVIPEFYSISSRIFNKSKAPIKTIDELLDKINENLNYIGKNKYKKLELYEISFNEEDKKHMINILDKNNVKFTSGIDLTHKLYNEFLKILKGISL